MAYRNPAFMVRHYGAEVGVAAISSSVAAATGFGKERLIDYRLANNFKFSTSASGHWIEYDLGALGGATVNRIVIPAGHNLNGVTLTVKSGASTPPATSRGSAAAAATLFDLSLTSSTDRYWRLEFGSSGQWELPEFWLGNYSQLATGPKHAWDITHYSPAVIRAFATREAVLVAGAVRRRIALEHQALTPTTAADNYGQIMVQGVFTPFWVWFPDDTLGGPWLMRLSEDVSRVQDHPAPSNGPTYTYSLRALEQLT